MNMYVCVGMKGKRGKILNPLHVKTCHDFRSVCIVLGICMYVRRMVFVCLLKLFLLF